MPRKERNNLDKYYYINIGLVIGFLLAVVIMMLLSCGGQQAQDVVIDEDPEEAMELMCGRFDGCREMTEREFVIWVFTIDCMKGLDLIPIFINIHSIAPPLIKEEPGFFMCGDFLAAGCAHLSLNLIRVITFDAAKLEEEGMSEGVYTHEYCHILNFAFNDDITHNSTCYTMPQECIIASRRLF